MAIEAPVSKYRKTNLKIYAIICIVAAIWFAYDGYLNKDFKKEHTNSSGKGDTTFIVNRSAPPFLILAAAFFGAWLFAIRNKKIIADDKELIISVKEKIAYDDIQKIDKTYFDKKGFFVIEHKDGKGKQIQRKLSDRHYDNLDAILGHLVAKIT